MKKLFAGAPLLLFLALYLTGCCPVGSKSGSPLVVYGAAAVISLALLIGYIRIVRKKNVWFITLFSSVLVVNTGYTVLAVFTGLEMALWANRISYLGSVCLPLSMLMIILHETNTPYRKQLPQVLLGASGLIFLIAASPGILPIYYKEVAFSAVGGVSTLVKVYGPLHPLYLFYLVGYFSAMVAVILRAQLKKTIDTTCHAVILAIAVFVNLGVWFIEQLVHIDFEFLSISYIISELFLLGVHLVMNENHRLREIIHQVETSAPHSPSAEASTPEVMLETRLDIETVAPERIEFYLAGLSTLTPTERAIYDAHLARVTSKEIMATLNIKESTLKYHNRNLYSKLGVANRKELLELHKYIKSVKEKLGEAGYVAGK